MDSLPIANAEVTRFFRGKRGNFRRLRPARSTTPRRGPSVSSGRAGGFGTHNDVIPGIEQWIKTQWNNVWSKTSDFRFVLEPGRSYSPRPTARWRS